MATLAMAATPPPSRPELERFYDKLTRATSSQRAESGKRFDAWINSAEALDEMRTALVTALSMSTPTQRTDLRAQWIKAEVDVLNAVLDDPVLAADERKQIADALQRHTAFMQAAANDGLKLTGIKMPPKPRGEHPDVKRSALASGSDQPDEPSDSPRSSASDLPSGGGKRKEIMGGEIVLFDDDE